ncbi:MAG: hypothetical protein IZT59_11225 [Verrucomicrobia bacterium]|jgi:hypothetical protein|nr:hypothetical protein [Verrucomicrobiota bacterium]|tara:strand:- start:34011 stop:34697 length:687 start_codon:yes stop_codon:yes gene_type:complete
MKISEKPIFLIRTFDGALFTKIHISNNFMQIFNSSSPLAWGELDVPLLGITSDWFGKTLTPPLAFSLASDSKHLWFIATRQAPASVLPDAIPGRFTPDLWKHDVAELFIADPKGKSYLEFNLAPNGAWWAAKFSSQRQLSEVQPDFECHMKAYADATDPTTWVAALSIPLEFLGEHICFGMGSPINTTFILNSPAQTFHTAAKLPGEKPDFHQPSEFPKSMLLKLPLR